jgi:methylenetetrahydrofolate dehydrogenase (NADP+)/methenyltetrahydrofolate cyclohydrolase/formyltetrahydrofolate synthetase
VVADVGIPNIVRGNWIKKGAVIIDMGTNEVKVTTITESQLQ